MGTQRTSNFKWFWQIFPDLLRLEVKSDFGWTGFFLLTLYSRIFVLFSILIWQLLKPDQCWEYHLCCAIFLSLWNEINKSPNPPQNVIRLATVEHYLIEVLLCWWPHHQRCEELAPGTAVVVSFVIVQQVSSGHLTIKQITLIEGWLNSEPTARMFIPVKFRCFIWKENDRH